MFWLTVVAFFGLFLIAIAAAYVLVTNVLTIDDGTASLGLGALLVALLGAPFLIWRNVVAQKTLDTTRNGLVTDRINAAVASLGAEKEVKRQRVNSEGTPLYEDKSGSPDYKKPIFEVVTLPNMEVRVGAIHALGRIARENLGFHVQIMEILCAYVRENSPESSAVPYEPPKFLVNDRDEALTPETVKTYIEELRSGLETLKNSIPKPRSDIQTALEVLGRRTPEQKRREGGWPDPDRDAACIFDHPFPSPPSYPQTDSAAAHKVWRSQFASFRKGADALREKFRTQRTYRHDLRNSNLQGYDLSHLDLRGANLSGAQMQGADLGGAQMQGADIRGAHMQGARLSEAQMQGAVLFGAQMQGANLRGAQLQEADIGGAQMQAADLFEAQMQGVDLGRANMSEDTNTTGAILRGASVLFVDEEIIALLRPHWDDIIGFLETLPEGAPDHWVQIPRGGLDLAAMHTAWRAWAAALDPPVTIAPDYRRD
jgi:uncharacterized protein YjbI with pentapeptide repeats